MAAERPVIMAGSGVKISGAHAAFLRLVEAWGIRRLDLERTT
ncbi:MAG: hypothetical protein WKF75_03205 [Singulisphaera sp.]